MIYVGYLIEKADKLANALERLPKVSDQMYELEVIAGYAKNLQQEAQKLYRELAEDKRAASRSDA